MANHRKDIKNSYLQKLMDEFEVETLNDASKETGIDGTVLSRYNEGQPKAAMLAIAKEAAAWGKDPGEYLNGILESCGVDIRSKPKKHLKAS